MMISSFSALKAAPAPSHDQPPVIHTAVASFTNTIEKLHAACEALGMKEKHEPGKDPNTKPKVTEPPTPATPTVPWGDAKGTFELFDSAIKSLQDGRDKFSSVFTRHQAGPLMDALSTDLNNLYDLRQMAQMIGENNRMSRYVENPRFTAAVKADLHAAIHDSKKAVAMLKGNIAG